MLINLHFLGEFIAEILSDLTADANLILKVVFTLRL